MRNLIFIFVVIYFVSCESKPGNGLLGTWKKDSSSNGPSSKLSRPYEKGTLIIKNDGTYEYDWMADDVGGNSKGKYFITDSVDLKVLKLERAPNIYFVYRIVEYDQNRFKSISTQKYTALDDSIIFFEMIDIFKKVKETK